MTTLGGFVYLSVCYHEGMVRRGLKSICKCFRSKGLDCFDFLLTLLVLAVLSLVSIATFAYLTREEAFTPVTFASPAQVIDSDGTVPYVEGIDPPAVEVDGEVPVRLIRNINCVDFDCPRGAIPVTVEIYWEHLSADGSSIRTFLEVANFEGVYEEHSDYDLNAMATSVTNIRPIPVPDDVAAYIWQDGLEESIWRLDGFTIVDDRQRAAWTSQQFIVVSDNVNPDATD